MGHGRRCESGTSILFRGGFPARATALSGVVESDGNAVKCSRPLMDVTSSRIRASSPRARGAKKHANNESSGPENTPSRAPQKVQEDTNSKAPASNATRKTKVLTRPELCEADLLAAVASLYDDQLKPFGRILRKRLSERGVDPGLPSGEVGLRQLREICVESSWLSIEAEQGGEWTALLVSSKPNFVDIYSPVDRYPPELWLEAAEYFANLDEEVLPSGRFSCAQRLVDRKLPFLSGKSLGQVCHIVQLAISQKKMLGYSSDGITSYANSQTKLKDKAAAQLSACVGAGGAGVGELPLATWDVARKHLREILTKHMQEGLTSVPLSNIKRVFRTHYNTELSETSLGHSKLSELLQDARLDDTCTVKLLDQGYFVMPLFKLEEGNISPACPEHTLCTDVQISLEEAAPAFPARGENRYSPFALHQDGNAGPMVRNTFIHIASAGHVGARPRSQSVGKDFGSKKCPLEASIHSLGYMLEPVTSVELHMPQSPAMLALETPSPLWSWSEDRSRFQFSFDYADGCNESEQSNLESADQRFDSSQDHPEILAHLFDFQMDSLKQIDVQASPTPSMPALQTGSPSWSWTDFGKDHGIDSQDSDSSRFNFFVDDMLRTADTQEYHARPFFSDPVMPPPPLIQFDAPRQVVRLSDFV